MSDKDEGIVLFKCVAHKRGKNGSVVHIEVVGEGNNLEEFLESAQVGDKAVCTLDSSVADFSLQLFGSFAGEEMGKILDALQEAAKAPKTPGIRDIQIAKAMAEAITKEAND